MTEEEFFEEYEKGRRNFKGENLQGFNDTFDYHLGITHPELFVNDLATLLQENAPVMNRPLDGVNLRDLSNASIAYSNFLRAILIDANLSQMDARFANLSGANLKGADLTGADLRYALLIGTNLEGANLEEANLEGTNIICCNLDGAKLVNIKLDKNKIYWSNFNNTKFVNTSCIDTSFVFSTFQNSEIVNTNFEGAYFYLAKFHGAIITNSSFMRVSLSSSIISNISAYECDFSLTGAGGINAKKSKFINCLFYGASLNHSELSFVDFSGSNLARADLSSAILDNAILNRVDLEETNLYNASVEEVSLNQTILHKTLLININLYSFLNARLKHRDQSYIDHKSVAKTIISNPTHHLEHNPNPDLKRFLVKIGIPNIVAIYYIDSIRTLSPIQIISLMRSTFISYGSPDEDFASLLNKDLLENGVSTFFFPLNATFGEKLHSTMRRIEEYDRTILICSEQSLNRFGLQYELEKVIEREAREGGESYLIPIVLDDYLFESWEPARTETKTEILNRVVADFREKKNYKFQFNRLLEALRKTSDI